MLRYGQLKAEARHLAETVLEEVGGEPRELIATMADTLEAVKELQQLANELEERALARLVTGDEINLMGIGIFRSGFKNNRDTWDNRKLGYAAVKAAGTIAHPNDVVDVLDTVATITRWRQGELDKLGVDWTPYRHRVYGLPSINRIA